MMKINNKIVNQTAVISDAEMVKNHWKVYKICMIQTSSSTMGFGSLARKSKLTYSTVEYQYTWTIKDFCNYCLRGYSRSDSSTFLTGQDNQCAWSFDIYSGGYDEEYRDYVSIRIFLYEKEKHNDIKFTFEASVLDKNGHKHSSKGLFLSQETVNTAAGIIKDFVLRSHLLNKPELLPDGELRILCVIGFDNCINEGVGPEVIDIHHSYDTQALDYFAKLLNNDKFSDFTLVVGDDQFHVHRVLLSARSPVFEKMFTSNMKESHDGMTTIEDIDADVMEQLLHFVYVGRVDDISDEMAQKLLIVANKYEIETLRQICEDLLVKQLNVDNVYEILLLADMHNASKVKTKAIEFLRKNAKELATAKDFDVTIRSLPVTLQTDIICRFMTNFDS